jgi:prophage regulatory protein
MANASQQTTSHPAQFYRLPQLNQRLGVSGSTVWNWIKQGKFPRGISLSSNVTAWSSSEVDAWAQSKIDAAK